MNRFFRLIPVPIQIVLVAVSLSLLFWIWLFPEENTGSLVVYNHTDRPIYSFWVNGNWGGNASAKGGGSVTCCWDLSAETAEVSWILSRTQSQADEGVEEEALEVIREMPAREAGEDYLQVHFISYENVKLEWSASSQSILK